MSYNLWHYKSTPKRYIYVRPFWRPVATFVHPQRSTQQQVTCMPTWHTCTCHHSVTWYLECHAGIPALRRCAPYNSPPPAGSTRGGAARNNQAQRSTRHNTQLVPLKGYRRMQTCGCPREPNKTTTPATPPKVPGSMAPLGLQLANIHVCRGVQHVHTSQNVTLT